MFDEICSKAFNMIKEKLVSAPIMIVPNWNESFEIMCDLRTTPMSCSRSCVTLVIMSLE